MHTKLYDFSALSRTKKNHLSKVLISSQFSADVTNDTQDIKFLIDRLPKTMMAAKPLEDLPVKTFIITQRIVML